MLTGLPCPSCGITKSMVYFYDGNLSKSVTYHILGPAVVFFCLFIIMVFAIEIKTKREYFARYFYNRKLAYALALFLATYHLIRLVFFLQNHSASQIIKESIWK
jgi:hypothetical protein